MIGKQAVVLGQLGTLALRQNDLNEARRRYLEALAIFRANMANRKAKPCCGTSWAWSRKRPKTGPRPNGATKRAWRLKSA